MSEPIRVLAIDDEPAIRRMLRAGFDPTRFVLDEAGSLAEGERAVARNRPDVVLLDLGLPDGDAAEWLARLREWSDVPVIVLTANGRENDKVRLLDGGADDYLVKPFGWGELEARLRAAVRHARRAADPAPERATFGEWRLEFAEHRVFRNEAEVHLTPLEFRLLAELARHPDRVLTHRHLLREVWGPAYEDDVHTLRVHMGNLRKKVEADPARPRHLLTHPATGYRLAP